MKPGYAALIGLLFGSFLNVCIYRIPRDVSVVRPRSFCPGCNRQIRAADNIPILSYLLLRGRCRNCDYRIAIRYPLVELTTAILFAAVALHYRTVGSTLKWAFFESILIVLFWTDLEERILPDELTLGGTILGLLLAPAIRIPGSLIAIFFPDWRPSAQSLVNAIAGALLFSGSLWLLSVIYAAIRKREGVGQGDIKLLALFGAFLGVEGALEALLIGSVAGSVVGPLYLWARRRDLRTYELPFGSFLCVGAAIVPFLGWFSRQ